MQNDVNEAVGILTNDSAPMMGPVGGMGPINQGCNSIDILGLAQFHAQVMFGVSRHVSTSSALVLNLAQNAAQFGAQFCAQDF